MDSYQQHLLDNPEDAKWFNQELLRDNSSANNPESNAIRKEKKLGIPLAFIGKGAQYRSLLRAQHIAYRK